MRELVYRLAGIAIADEKVALLSNRLRKRLRSLNLDSFRAYYEMLTVCGPKDPEISQFLSAVSTNETYFFRNEKLWVFVSKDLISYLLEVNEGRTLKRARFWSAASSTGAEAYTLAMVLREKLPKFDEWQIEIVGTDISTARSRF